MCSNNLYTNICIIYFKNWCFTDDKNSGQFISCHYKYCETLVFEPELIDDLYCSLVCKDLDSKKMVSDNTISINNSSQKHTNPLAERPMIDRRVLLAKLESRINKRKQVLSSSYYPEKISRNDDWEEMEQVENSCDDHGQSSQNSSHQISSPEVVEDDNDEDGDDDDDDDDEIFNLKVYFKIINFNFQLNFKDFILF